MEYYTKPHRRHNPLTGEWVLVSPHRAQRPWHGQQEKPQEVAKNAYEPDCYLCPNNQRVSGEKNPNYPETYAFTNDHAALLADGENRQKQPENTDLFQAENVTGTAKVLCYSPRHDQTLADMQAKQIESVIKLWQTQIIELGKQYPWVQLFENKGEVMGCSAPHPHGQVWASSFIPVEAEKEDKQQRLYFKKHGNPLLLDYALKEATLQERVVCENADWLVVVPYWATWPFETLLLPKFKVLHLPDLTPAQSQSLALIIKALLGKYDRLFDVSFPYSMGWHGAPQKQEDTAHWQLHAHYYPPLLRSASVKKFMVGYEMLAQAQRDLTPEQAAQRLAAF